MKAFEIQEFGIGNLRLVERERPQVSSSYVLVKMTAASLNFRDLLVAKGQYNPRMKRPMTPLSDGVGIVEDIGPDVVRFKKGDHVAGCFMQKWIEGPITKEKAGSAMGGGIDGVLQEYRLFPEDGLVNIPTSLSDEEAATLPCAGVTAWHALFEHTPVVPGNTVLLQGTGGVSIFALQLAKAAGLQIIITSSSDEKLEKARHMGAHETINYKRNQDWEKEVQKLTGGLGVDHIIEVGGGDTLPRSLKAVRMGGVISMIGVLSGATSHITSSDMLMNSLRVQGVYVGSRSMFERFNKAIDLIKIKPVIDRTFHWTDYEQALRHMEGQSHFGKICLRF